MSKPFLELLEILVFIQSRPRIMGWVEIGMVNRVEWSGNNETRYGENQVRNGSYMNNGGIKTISVGK